MQEKKEYKIPTAEESFKWISWELKNLVKVMTSIEGVLNQIKDELKPRMPQIQAQRQEFQKDLPF